MLSGEANTVAAAQAATRPARYLVDVILDGLVSIGVAGAVTLVTLSATAPGPAPASTSAPVQHLVLIPKAATP
ncbi:MAG TPA: hypothetical protein VHD87_15540 [Acidimicrobiales bacterium]|nr:hypothetical protein [Acidimicrobiales bacterium]